MEHSFNIYIAKEFGIVEAILIQHFEYWIAKNQANQKNFYNGFYWTYNSTRAFSELFPYLSQRQVQYALNHLKEEDIIQTGNFNKSTYDRTLWYAFTKKGLSILQNCKMEGAKMLNGITENVKPIPNINTNINQINNNNKELFNYDWLNDDEEVA